LYVNLCSSVITITNSSDDDDDDDDDDGGGGDDNDDDDIGIEEYEGPLLSYEALPSAIWT
jgi:hypothetical protein